MKRALTLFLALLMCGLLFACTPTDTTPVDTTASPDTHAPTEAPTAAPTEPEETTAENTTEEATTESAEPAPEPSPVVLYQLAPEANSLMQSYVIKTSSGKLIVIDGGVDGEGKDRAPYMPTALRAIAGVGDGEYFEVEAWFLSHAHKDHTYELSKMLAEYSAESNYKIHNIYFDFPEFGTAEYPAQNADMDASKIVENINKYGEVIGKGENYYDALNGAVINTAAVAEGLSFEIDGVKIDVLQTWDIADGTSNLNDTSIVLRFTIGEQTVLFLNDLGSIGGRRLLATYGDELKSDIVQMAHHGQAGVAKDVYAAIGAQIHLWPTPVWVWNNANKIYQIDEVRTWLYGETFLEADEYNIVAGLYTKYPASFTKVKAWEKVLDGMKIEFPYILPDRPCMVPEETQPPEEFTPVEHDYVSNGLVAYYSGTQNDRDGHNKDSDKWEDLVGGHDMTITKNDTNYFTDEGLKTANAKHNFPQAVVDTVNGEAFTVEILLGDFVSLGSDFNTFLNGSGDEIALFRRKSVNELELKFAINAGVRIKVKDCLNLLQNSLVTITYAQNDVVRMYINGELVGETPTISGSLGASDLFIGHNAANKAFDTTYRAVRFYDRALTAEEVMANAVVDGVMAEW